MVGYESNGLDGAAAPLDYEGRTLDCQNCQVRTQAQQSECSLGHACAQDRYAPRIWRFFRQNPQYA